MGLVALVLACLLSVALAWIGAKAAGEPLSFREGGRAPLAASKAAVALWTLSAVAGATAALGVLAGEVGIGAGSLAIGGCVMARSLTGSRPSPLTIGLTVVLMAIPVAIALSVGALTHENLMGIQAVNGPIASWSTSSGWVARAGILAMILSAPLWVQSLPTSGLPLGPSATRAIEGAIAAVVVSSAAFGPGLGAALLGPLDQQSAIGIGSALSAAVFCVILVGSLRRLARRVVTAD